MKRNKLFFSLILLTPLLSGCDSIKPKWILKQMNESSYRASLFTYGDSEKSINVDNIYSYDENGYHTVTIYKQNYFKTTYYQAEDDSILEEYLSEDNNVVINRVGENFSSKYVLFKDFTASDFHKDKTIDNEKASLLFYRLTGEERTFSSCTFNIDLFQCIEDIHFDDYCLYFDYLSDGNITNHMSKANNKTPMFDSIVSALDQSYTIRLTTFLDGLIDETYYLFKTDEYIYLHNNKYIDCSTLGDLLYINKGNQYREYIYDGETFQSSDLVNVNKILPNISALSSSLFYVVSDTYIQMEEDAYRFGVDNFMIPYFNKYDGYGFNISISHVENRLSSVDMEFYYQGEFVDFINDYFDFNDTTIPEYVVIPEY